MSRRKRWKSSCIGGSSAAGHAGPAVEQIGEVGTLPMGDLHHAAIPLSCSQGAADPSAEDRPQHPPLDASAESEGRTPSKEDTSKEDRPAKMARADKGTPEKVKGSDKAPDELPAAKRARADREAEGAEKPTAEDAEKPAADERLFACRQCSRVCKTAVGLASHVKQSHGLAHWGLGCLKPWHSRLFECPQCSRVCKTALGLASHVKQSHGQDDPRNYVAGPSCPACDRRFASRPEAVEHLSHQSAPCRRRLEQGELRRLAPEELAAAEVAERAAERAEEPQAGVRRVLRSKWRGGQQSCPAPALPGFNSHAVEQREMVKHVNGIKGSQEAVAADLRQSAIGSDSGSAAMPPQGSESAAEFPIDCTLTLHEEGFWVLAGVCRLCKEEFHARGCVVQTTGHVNRFNNHAQRQHQMVNHVELDHGIKGPWTAVRQICMEDPMKRLVFVHGEGEDRQQVHMEDPVKPPVSVHSDKDDKQQDQEASLLEEAEEDPVLSVTTKVIGRSPTVVVASGGPLPPKALLPEKAQVSRLEQRWSSPLRPQVFPETLAEARAAGVEAPAAWEGLGLVPEELRGGFGSLLIMGPSGSGKTTLLRAILSELFPDYTGSTYPCGEWAPNLPLIDAFDTAEEGSDFLNSVGLCSVPSWCKPFSVLSVGEQYRANVALALRRRREAPELPLVFDEWTSELDRDLARNVSLALGKRMRKEGQTAEGKVGPYIFATCHEDALKYLQPELICYCSVGEAPRVLPNPLAGSAPKLQAVLRGEPIASEEGLGSGPWAVEGSSSTFSIRPHPSMDGAFTISGLWCKENKLLCPSNEEVQPDEVYPGPWYANEALSVRLVSRDVLQVLYTSDDGLCKHVKELKAVRVKALHTWPPSMLAMEPAAQRPKNRDIDYRDVDMHALERLGWYLPPELQQDALYAGLQRSCEPVRVSPPVCWEHTGDDGLRHYYLAAYVGNANGSLSPKLLDVSALLDCPFDGLCVHEVPELPELGEFSVGVITGPSGSGKSSLVRKLFGPSPSVQWAEEPVLAHFDSLARARELCGAACLELGAAMRPYGCLSAGEQARAKIARLLDAALRSEDAGEAQPKRPLVLEEFTSLLDRALARRVARSIQRLATQRGLRIVAVSCHRDFVAAGLLEPDWLFECHNSRLLRFRTSAAKMKADAKRLEDATTAEQRTVLLLHRMEQQTAEPCFSDEFKAELSKALESLGARELERRRLEIAGLERALSEASAVAVAAESPEEVEAEEELGKGSSEDVVKLEVRRALLCEWAHFMEHHYKDHKIKGDSKAFVGLVDGRLACFTATVRDPMNFVNRAAVAKRLPEGVYPSSWEEAFPPRLLFREHRTVVLPDFQGMGLGPLLCDTVAAYLHSLGHDFTSQTIHPFYGSYRERSPFWRPMHTNRSKLNGNLKYSHFFVGATRGDGSEEPELREQLAARVVLDLASETA